MEADTLVVNYHYVRPERVRGLHPCPEKTFLAQVDYLAGRYAIVTPGEVLEAARRGRPGRFCALTFDDGLKEHAAFVFPELRRRGVPGTFFVIGGVLRDGKIPQTQKLHLLLNRFESRELRDRFHAFSGGSPFIDDKEFLDPRRRFDDVVTANLKETLMRLPSDRRRAFIDGAFAEAFDETREARTLFLTLEEARQMHEGGMEIGGHGYSHSSLEGLDEAAQRQDIASATRLLADALGRPPATFSYPHGRHTEATPEILRSQGYRYAVTIQPAGVDGSTDPYRIPRFDTNDLRAAMDKAAPQR